MDNISKKLYDVASERGVLAGLIRYKDAYYDIADILQSSTFTLPQNQVIFDCIKHIKDTYENLIIDLPSIYSAATELGVSHLFEQKQNILHLQAVIDLPVDESNVRKFAAKIRKLEVARLLHNQLAVAQNKLVELDGSESITQILGIAEDSIFDFSSLLNDRDNEPVSLGEGLHNYLQYLGNNPTSTIGISTGYKEYDWAIGGGLRNGTVNMIGARAKTGKTILSDNIGNYIASELNIPVLNLDTEMSLTDHQIRLTALRTSTPIHNIETGTAKNFDRILEESKLIEKIPYYHKSIAGCPFEEQIAIARRWIVKTVGLNEDGTSKPCVIIYDYLKLMSSEGLNKDLKEYQLLGFMMTSLHNFAVRYQIPILSFIQLNREGINKEEQNVISGSDRIIWLCSNFSILKGKSPEEIAEDGHQYGNRKIVVVAARHGEAMDLGDYIMCNMQGKYAKIEEIGRKFQTLHQQEQNGFNLQDGLGEDIPFDNETIQKTDS